MKFTKQITLLAFLFSGSLVSSQEPVLNEFLASNESGIRDEDGELQDWIEIHNPHDRELNLDGWYLSDRSDDLARWRFARGCNHRTNKTTQRRICQECEALCSGQTSRHS